MNDFIKVLASIWSELDSVIELFVYLMIALGIHRFLGTTFLQGVAIVFSYFILNLFRLLVETYRRNTLHHNSR